MKKTLQVLHSSKFVWFGYWLIIARLFPFLVIAYEFDLLKSQTETKYQLGIIGPILIAWTVFTLWKHLSRWVHTFPDGMTREILQASVGLGPYLLLWALGVVAVTFTDNFMFVAVTLLVSQAAGIYFRARYEMLHRKALKKRGYVDVIK